MALLLTLDKIHLFLPAPILIVLLVLLLLAGLNSPDISFAQFEQVHFFCKFLFHFNPLNASLTKWSNTLK